MVRESKELSLDDKRRFYKSCNKVGPAALAGQWFRQRLKWCFALLQNFGSTALCLSGGASFGYYHFGVVKGTSGPWQTPESD